LASGFFAEGSAAIASPVEHSGPGTAQFTPGQIQNRVRFETKRRPHASTPRASNLLRDRPGNAPFDVCREDQRSERRTIMNRTFMLAIALVALPTAGLTVLDVQAQSVPAACSASNSRAADPVNEDPDHIAAALRAKGVNVARIESFGGCIRAYITDANGTESMAYFTPGTLEPLNGTGAAAGVTTGAGQSVPLAGPSGNSADRTTTNTNGGDSTMGAPTTGAHGTTK
jgi:hypothetical protein